MKINFAPRFASRWGYERGNAEYIERIFRAKYKEQVAFINVIGEYGANLNEIPLTIEEAIEPRWSQNWFPPLDGMSAYVMAANKKPKTIFEIGSGNSTKFFARALRDYALDSKILSIDPEPREEIDVLCDAVFRVPLEDVELERFGALRPGDVLFFDGSHRSFQNSDVTVFFIDVLPRIPDGVIVGIHDIFWPLDYPEKWVDRYYNEQYLLGAYMLAYGELFPLIFSASYAWRYCMKEITCALPSELVAKLPKIKGGSLWFEKKTVAALST